MNKTMKAVLLGAALAGTMLPGFPNYITRIHEKN